MGMCTQSIEGQRLVRIMKMQRRCVSCRIAGRSGIWEMKEQNSHCNWIFGDQRGYGNRKKNDSNGNVYVDLGKTGGNIFENFEMLLISLINGIQIHSCQILKIESRLEFLPCILGNLPSPEQLTWPQVRGHSPENRQKFY